MTTENDGKKTDEKPQWTPSPSVERALKHVDDASPLPPKPAEK
jgi:hypothetical protein